MKVKEFEKQLTEMVNNFEGKDFKKNATQELAALTRKKDVNCCSSIRFIINDYPDFNHIELKVTQPDVFVMKICVNPEVLKDNPKSIKKLAKMFKFWLKSGRIE